MSMVLINCSSTSTAYYQSGLHLFRLVSSGSVQTFTAPVDGIYRLTCYGAYGGSYLAAPGGVACDYELSAQQVLYVYVGEQGRWANSPQGAFNGGGSAVYDISMNRGTFGGGATHISTTRNQIYNNRTWNPIGTILIAGGAGGGSSHYGNGPHNKFAGATGGLWQNSARNNRQGSGGNASSNMSGGGAGWYGGQAFGFGPGSGAGYGGSNYVPDNNAKNIWTQAGPGPDRFAQCLLIETK